MNFVGKKAKGRISKRILQKNKARKRACVHQGKEIFIFWKICNTRFEIHPFALLSSKLPTTFQKQCHI